MTVDPLAVALLGVGYAAATVARIGLAEQETQKRGSGTGRGFLPEKKPKRRDDDDVLVLFLI